MQCLDPRNELECLDFPEPASAGDPPPDASVADAAPGSSAAAPAPNTSAGVAPPAEEVEEQRLLLGGRIEPTGCIPAVIPVATGQRVAPIIIVGIAGHSGVGKSTVAHYLSETFQSPFREYDCIVAVQKHLVRTYSDVLHSQEVLRDCIGG